MPIPFLDEEDLRGVWAAERRERGYRDQRSPWLEDRRRPGEHVSVGRVEHQVRLADRIFQAFGFQRHEPVSAQLQDQGPGMAAPGPDLVAGGLGHQA